MKPELEPTGGTLAGRPDPTRDRIAAVCLALGFGLFFGLTFRTNPFGECARIIDCVVLGAHKEAVHVGFVLLARAVLSALGGATPESLNAFVAVVSGLALAACFGFLRAMRIERTAALAATVIVGLSPAVGFESTIVDYHATHMLFTASAFAVAARLGRRWSGLGVAALGALHVALYLTHTSGVLVVPALALLALAKEGVAPAVRLRRLVELGLAFALAQAAGMLVASLVVSGRWELSFVPTARLGKYAAVGLDWKRVMVLGWLEPLAPVLVAASTLLLHPRPLRPWILAALGLLPVVAFFGWMGFTERGAYTLGTMPLWALLVAVAWRRSRVPVRLLVLAVALGFGVRETAERLRLPAEDSFAARAAVVAEVLPAGGTLYSMQRRYPLVQCTSSNVEEFNFGDVLTGTRRLGLGPEEFARRFVEFIRSKATPGRSASALDLSYRRSNELYELARPHLDALESRLKRVLGATEVRRGNHRFLVFEVEPRATGEPDPEGASDERP